MNRNTNERFALNPTHLDIGRSRFDRGHGVKTAFNVGDLIPFYVDEVLPGDTFSIKTSKVLRMPSLITPVMDNFYLDTYYFFVPNRIVWNHWEELQGENKQSAWVPPVTYEVPQIVAPQYGWQVSSIADYMGIPTGVTGLSVNALPFRAYALICNEWFRDENLTDPLNIPLGDATVTGSPYSALQPENSSYITEVALGGPPFKVAKYHDYFTSALPSPQKGPDVTIPLTQGVDLPVVPKSEYVPLTGQSQGISYPALWRYGVDSPPIVTEPGQSQGLVFPATDSSDGWEALGIKSGSFGQEVVDYLTGPESRKSRALTPINLWALAGQDVALATVNQLRTAFQIQKLYEADARGGTRYIEILKSHFGVTSPDARLQRPEYLGGNRVPININQVLQSSPTDMSPQGTPTGQSLTTDVHGDFSKSFVEHGFIIGLMCVRYDHTYQQGLERFWSRRDRFDYYFPVFANLGEQAILNKEIYAQGTTEDDEVFGYQEAWADYRYKPSHVTGMMRSQFGQSLDSWHVADYYHQLPKLSDSWIREDDKNLDRILAVQSEISSQFFCDIWIDCRCTRPMPLYSIPGLIDHH